jgi:hypothetical protein
MKKALSLILALALCLSLCACGSESKEASPAQSGTTEHSAEITDPEVSTPTTDAEHPAEYVGEWKNYRKISSEGDFGTYRVVFHADGSGSYFNSSDKETKGDWYYDADNHCLVLQLPVGNAAFYIQEENGKTVLDYYDDIFYRADEFVENNG